jgi:hypothetical protein
MSISTSLRELNRRLGKEISLIRNSSIKKSSDKPRKTRKISEKVKMLAVARKMHRA